MADKLPLEDESIVNIRIVERLFDGNVVFNVVVRCPEGGAAAVDYQGAEKLANALKAAFERYALDDVHLAFLPASARAA